MVEENHLGGFLIEGDPATFMPNLWMYICKKYNINSVIDLGCGMGYALMEFQKHVKHVCGIDGSDFVQQYSMAKNWIEKVDFANEKKVLNTRFDLCWSCEFLEHVEEKYIENYIDIFKKSKYIAITYADLNQDGYHHVNCNNEEYWINLFSKYNLEYKENETLEFRQCAYQDALIHNPTYKDNHFYNRGLFFVNNSF